MLFRSDYVAKNEGYRIIDEDLGAEQYGIAFRSADATFRPCATIIGDKMMARGWFSCHVAKERFSCHAAEERSCRAARV